MIDRAYETALKTAFFDLHRCDARWLRTIPVIERWDDKTVWEGDVELFYLVGHPKATVGYAWAHDKEQGSEIVAVLELPPVMSALTAVQVYIVEKFKKDSRN